MHVESLHPGVMLDQVRQQTGFELLVADPLGTTPVPTDEQLAVLRDEVDPAPLHHRAVMARADHAPLPATMSLTTLPLTSVNRMSRPA